MTLLETTDDIEVPDRVATCPYCGGKLSIRAHTWTQNDDGAWIATGIDVDCDTEPDIDGDEWDDWNTRHSYMPYVNWLPLHERLMKWMRKRFRFKCDD